MPTLYIHRISNDQWYEGRKRSDEPFPAGWAEEWLQRISDEFGLNPSDLEVVESDIDLRTDTFSKPDPPVVLTRDEQLSLDMDTATSVTAIRAALKKYADAPA